MSLLTGGVTIPPLVGKGVPAAPGKPPAAPINSPFGKPSLPSGLTSYGGASPNPDAFSSLGGPASAPATLSAEQQFLQSVAQAAQNYSPGGSVGGGSSIVQTGPSLAQIEQMTGLGNYTAPTLADLTGQAKNQVSLTLDPQLAALQRQEDQANATGTQQKNDLTQNYGRLQDFINAATQQGNASFGQAANAQQSGFQNLLNGIGQNYSNGKQAVNAEQGRLGLTGINNSAFDRDAEFLNGLAQNNRTAAANTLSSQQANFNGTQGLLGSAEQAGGAAAQTKLAATLAQLLGGLQGQYSQLSGSRGQLEQQALASLQTAAQQAQSQHIQELLSEISAANSGTKTVSGGSTRIPASGISPLQALQLTQGALAGDRADSAAQRSAQRQSLQDSISQANLLGSIQNNLTSGKLNSAQQKAYADKINQLLPGFLGGP